MIRSAAAWPIPAAADALRRAAQQGRDSAIARMAPHWLGISVEMRFVPAHASVVFRYNASLASLKRCAFQPLCIGGKITNQEETSVFNFVSAPKTRCVAQFLA